VLLRAVQCQGYKGFSQSTRLPLRKITVLFGKNNSGKTTLARLPMFTAASFANNSTMYALAHNNIAFGASFLDLASLNQPHPRISFGMEWSRNNRLNVTLQNVISHAQEDTVQPVFFEMDRDVRIELSLRPGISESVYNQIAQRMTNDQQVRFQQRLHAARDLLGQTVHIPSTRPRIEAAYTMLQPGPRNVEEVPYFLASKSQLRISVDRWVQAAFDGASITVDQAAFAFRLSESRDDISVNLSESGRGLQSAIFVIALLMEIANSKRGTQLVILEEPEAHLHPSIHGAMADLVITCSRRCQIIVETHSENFILRLRRRIAERQIKHTEIGLYYMDNMRKVNLVTIDPTGSVDDWPFGVFESDVNEAQAIVEAKISAMTNLGEM
jgi:predicted ATPase